MKSVFEFLFKIIYMNLRIIPLITLVIGLSILSYSLSISYYKVENATVLLMDSGDDYYQKDTELRTNKTELMDFGSGLSVFSICLLSFLFISKSKTFDDLKQVKSLKKIWILITANIAWYLMLPGTDWYYLFRGSRGDYPPFADSIAIPISLQIPFFIRFFIPLNIFIVLVMIKSKLPSLIFIKSDRYMAIPILWEILFGLFLFLNLVLMVFFIIDGDHFSIVVSFYFLYILLSLRAGQINKLQLNNKIQNP